MITAFLCLSAGSAFPDERLGALWAGCSNFLFALGAFLLCGLLRLYKLDLIVDLLIPFLFETEIVFA